MWEFVKSGICLLQQLAQFKFDYIKVTRNMGMVCVYLSLRNIMKMHDCRKRQVEIERQRSRKAAKQEKKGKKNREAEQREARKAEKQKSRKKTK